MADSVDRDALRMAVHAEHPAALLAVIRGRDIGASLQRIGTAMLRMAWTSQEHRATLQPAMAEVVDRLRERGEIGDRLLADDLMTIGAGRTIDGIVLAVDLEELADAASNHVEHPGGYLNLTTGEVIHGFMTDAYVVGEEDAIDLDESEDDWLHVLLESHDGWNDMDDFASTVTDPRIATSLDRALHGRRPFAHFKDAVHRADIADDWYAFEEERQLGRLRRMLVGDRVHPV